LSNVPEGEEDLVPAKIFSEYSFNRLEYEEPENFKRVTDDSFEEGNSSSEETEEEFDWYDGREHD